MADEDEYETSMGRKKVTIDSKWGRGQGRSSAAVGMTDSNELRASHLLDPEGNQELAHR